MFKKFNSKIYCIHFNQVNKYLLLKNTSLFFETSILWYIFAFKLHDYLITLLGWNRSILMLSVFLWNWNLGWNVVTMR